MDVFEAIKSRTSYRGIFKNQPIPREHLIQIVQAGLDAPSAKNVQTTRFVIIDDKELIRKMTGSLPKRDFFKTCQAMILCITDKHPQSVLESHQFQIEDCAAAVENMLLAITALGYATVWIDGMLRLERIAEKIAEVIHLPDNKKVQILLPLGVPAEQGPRKEKMPFDERAWFNVYPNKEMNDA